MSTGPAVPAYSATLGSFNGCTPALARPLPPAAPRTKSTSPPTPLTITSGFQSGRRTGSRSHQPRRLSAIPTSAAQASSPTRRLGGRDGPPRPVGPLFGRCHGPQRGGLPTAPKAARIQNPAGGGSIGGERL